ncbi:RHS repeat-associated core domain-containing protein [Nostoc sp. NIES-2111]
MLLLVMGFTYAHAYNTATVTNYSAGNTSGRLGGIIREAQAAWALTGNATAINLNATAGLTQPPVLHIGADFPIISTPVYIYSSYPVIIDFGAVSPGFVIRSNHVRFDGLGKPSNPVSVDWDFALEKFQILKIRMQNFTKAAIQVECGAEIYIGSLVIECSGLSNGIMLANTANATVAGNVIFGRISTSPGDPDPENPVEGESYRTSVPKDASMAALFQYAMGATGMSEQELLDLIDQAPFLDGSSATQVKNGLAEKGVSNSQWESLQSIGGGGPGTPAPDPGNLSPQASIGIAVRQWDCTPCTNIEAQSQATYDAYPSEGWTTPVTNPWCSDYPCIYAKNSALGTPAYPDGSIEIDIVFNVIGYTYVGTQLKAGRINTGIQILGGKDIHVTSNSLSLCLEAGISVTSSHSVALKGNAVGVHPTLGVFRPDGLSEAEFWYNVGIKLGCDNGSISLAENKIGGFQEGVKMSFQKCQTSVSVRDDEGSTYSAAYHVQGNAIGGRYQGVSYSNRIGLLADRPALDADLCPQGTAFLKANEICSNEITGLMLADKTGVSLESNIFSENGTLDPLPNHEQQRSILVEERDPAQALYPVMPPTVLLCMDPSTALSTTGGDIRVYKIGVANAGVHSGVFRFERISSVAGTISLFAARRPGDAEVLITSGLSSSFDYTANLISGVDYPYVVAHITRPDGSSQNTTSEFSIPVDLRKLCPQMDFLSGTGNTLSVRAVNPGCSTQVLSPVVFQGANMISSCVTTAGPLSLNTNLNPAGPNNGSIRVTYKVLNYYDGSLIATLANKDLSYVLSMSPGISSSTRPCPGNPSQPCSDRIVKIQIQAGDGNNPCGVIYEVVVDQRSSSAELTERKPAYCERPRAGAATFSVQNVTEAFVRLSPATTGSYDQADFQFSNGQLRVTNLEAGTYTLYGSAPSTCSSCQADPITFTIPSQELSLTVASRIVALPCRSGNYTSDQGTLPTLPSTICDPAFNPTDGSMLIAFQGGFSPTDPGVQSDYDKYAFEAFIVDETGAVVRTAATCNGSSVNGEFTPSELSSPVQFKLLVNPYELKVSRAYKVVVKVFGKKPCPTGTDDDCSEYILLCDAEDYIRTVPVDLNLQATQSQWIQDGVAQFLVCPDNKSYNSTSEGPGDPINAIRLALTWNPAISPRPDLSGLTISYQEVNTSTPDLIPVSGSPSTISYNAADNTGAESGMSYWTAPFFPDDANPYKRYRYSVEFMNCKASLDVAQRRILPSVVNDPTKFGIKWLSRPGCGRDGQVALLTDGTASTVLTSWFIGGTGNGFSETVTADVSGFPTGPVQSYSNRVVSVVVRLKEGTGECMLAPNASLSTTPTKTFETPTLTATVKDPRELLPAVTALFQPRTQTSILPSNTTTTGGTTTAGKLNECSVVIQLGRNEDMSNPSFPGGVVHDQLEEYGSLVNPWKITWYEISPTTNGSFAEAGSTTISPEVSVDGSGNKHYLLESSFLSVGHDNIYTAKVEDPSSGCLLGVYYPAAGTFAHCETSATQQPFCQVHYRKPLRNRRFSLLAGWGAVKPDDKPVASIDVSSLASQMGNALDNARQQCLDRSSQQGRELALGIKEGRYLNESASYGLPKSPDNLTLFYYDRAQRLIATVPPEGYNRDNPATVNGTTGEITVNHRLGTVYQYDMRGRRVAEKNPDAAVKEVGYDDAGRVLFAQSGRQRNDCSPQRVSYMNYDDLGRVVEAGEANLPTGTTSFASWFATSRTLGSKLDLVRTGYDIIPTTVPAISTGQGETNWNTSAWPLTPTAMGSANLMRGRIAYTVSWQSQGPGGTGWRTVTGYAYDVHGNVKKLYQYLPWQTPLALSYTYDLVSGKVRTLTQAEGTAHQFIRRFRYDADQRLRKVESSREGWLWAEDARYSYLPTGQLARQELGAHHVQGIDYAYTVNGWLKSINGTGEDGTATTPAVGGGTAPNGDEEALNLPGRAPLIASAYDPGHDGANTGDDGAEPLDNAAITAPDAFAMRLDYFAGDYRTNSGVSGPYAWMSQTPPAPGTPSPLADLFDGNIASWGWSTQGLSASDPLARVLRREHYRYDRSGRLILSRPTNPGDATPSAGSWAGSISGAFSTRYRYDRNGNLSALERLNEAGTSIDALTYAYNGTTKTSNRLLSVTDASSQTVGAKTASYTYDSDGNLVNDGDVAISWNNRAKVSKVHPASGSDSYYLYDGLNNKTVRYTASTPPQLEWHLLDGAGTGSAVLKGSTTQLDEAEIRLTGTDAIGTLDLDLNGAAPPSGSLATAESEERKSFELKDHLGNIRSLTAGVRLFDPTRRLSTAGLSDMKEYYPFGMVARSYGPQRYRWGYTGKELDANTGDRYDYGARLYDPAVGRWLSLDPLAGKYTGFSPYNYVLNNPIVYKDIDGRDTWYYTYDGRFLGYVIDGKPDAIAVMNSHLGAYLPNLLDRKYATMVYPIKPIYDFLQEVEKYYCTGKYQNPTLHPERIQFLNIHGNVIIPEGHISSQGDPKSVDHDDYRGYTNSVADIHNHNDDENGPSPVDNYRSSGQFRYLSILVGPRGMTFYYNSGAVLGNINRFTSYTFKLKWDWIGIRGPLFGSKGETIRSRISDSSPKSGGSSKSKEKSPAKSAKVRVSKNTRKPGGYQKLR